MRFQLRSQQDIIDFTNGCCFFGTGGGGDPAFGQKILKEAGKTIEVIDVEDLPDNAMTVCPFLMGPSGQENMRLQKELGLNKKCVSNMPLMATILLLEQEQASVNAIIPIEVGGAATACAAATAAALGVPLVDGDYAGGRSLPEITQMLPSLNGLSFCPLMSVDAFGNQVLIRKAINNKMEECLGKKIAGASGGLAGQAGLLQPLARVKTSICKGTLSRAFRLGQSIRQATEAGNPMIPNIIEHTGAQFVIKGTVTECKSYEKDGYTFGEQVIRENGNQVKITFKNEYLELWKNEEPFAKSTHLICVVQYPSGQPLLNSQVKEGDSVAVFTINNSVNICQR